MNETCFYDQKLKSENGNNFFHNKMWFDENKTTFITRLARSKHPTVDGHLSIAMDYFKKRKVHRFHNFL